AARGPARPWRNTVGADGPLPRPVVSVVVEGASRGGLGAFRGVSAPQSGAAPRARASQYREDRSMSKTSIIRAWKDREYRESLREAERALLPGNPAGLIELTEAELKAAAGGTGYCT